MEYLGTEKPINKIQPVVSVCITTYNHAAFIAECLDSVLMQETDFHFEIIVGEDDSTDGTREICKQYAEKFPDKIRLFLRNADDKIFINGKKTGRFNFLENFKSARGKYIALCDGDDYWLTSSKLQFQYNFLINNPVHFAITERNENNKLYHSQNFDLLGLYREVYVGKTSSLFFRNFDVNDFLTLLKSCGTADTPLLHIIASKGLIHLDTTNCVYYRLHENSMWTYMKKVDQATIQLQQAKIIASHFNIPLKLKARRYLVYLKIIYKDHLKNKNYFSFLNHYTQYLFWKSLRLAYKFSSKIKRFGKK
jgi:glycosyltransferase involved in cell wall biosynthesis